MSSEKTEKATLKVLCIDLDKTIPFLRTVSYAIVAQRTTRIAWREEQGALKYLYKAFLGAFGTPGLAEVVTAPEAQIRKQVDIETHHRIDVLMTKAEIGPAAVVKYLSHLEEIRAFNLQALKDQYAEVGGINREIAREWGGAIEFLADIKLIATVWVKLQGQIPGPAWLVSLGYDIIVGTIDDSNDIGQAKGVAMIASDNALKESGKEVAGRVAEGTVDKLNKQATAEELKHAITRMRQLETKLERQTTKLGQRYFEKGLGMGGPRIQESIKSLSAQIPKNGAKLDQAQKAVLKSAGKAALAKTVSWIFLTKDIFEAFDKHDKAVAAARR